MAVDVVAAPFAFAKTALGQGRLPYLLTLEKKGGAERLHYSSNDNSTLQIAHGTTDHSCALHLSETNVHT